MQGGHIVHVVNNVSKQSYTPPQKVLTNVGGANPILGGGMGGGIGGNQMMGNPMMGMSGMGGNP